MSLFSPFIPIFLFIFVFVGSGVCFSLMGKENAFSILSPTVAIIPSIVLAWIRSKKSPQEKMSNFLNGIGHRDIIYMCVVFLLAGAFGAVAKTIGSVDATINLIMSLVPAKFLVIGLFFASAFLSSSTGTAVGTIASVGPIAAELCFHTTGLSAPLAMGTVIGGAFLGDNLSMVSSTTIAAVSSQGADTQKRFKINLPIALITATITIFILWSTTTISSNVRMGDFSLWLVLPYILLLILAFSRVNVFVCLLTSTVVAGIIGLFTQKNYEFVTFSNGICTGFRNVNDVLILTLLIGGLTGLIGNRAIEKIADAISVWISQKEADSKLPQFVLAGLVSTFTLLFANNVIAIILCGGMAKMIAKSNGISPHYSASILGIFATAVKGILPYGSQVLLAASIANISPLSIAPHVYYCHMLIVVGILFILLGHKKSPFLN